MSESRAAGTASVAAQRAMAGANRVWRAHRELSHEQRLAAYAAIGLFLTLFLPWYQETVIASGRTALQSKSVSLTAWGAFSFVEAAILIVAAGVLILLFQRAEGRAFHLPGGDGWVITAAGLWTCVLVVWRIFDKQSTSVQGPGATTSGIEWGIFVALAVAAFLAYAGSRIRAAHVPEPALPGEDGPRSEEGGGPPAGGPPPESRPAAAERPSRAAERPSSAAERPSPAPERPSRAAERPSPGRAQRPAPAGRATPPADAGAASLAALVRSVAASKRAGAADPPPRAAQPPPRAAQPPPHAAPPPADEAPTRRRRPKLLPDPPPPAQTRDTQPTLPAKPRRPDE